MSASLAMALVRKASLIANDMEKRSKNHRDLANILADEGLHGEAKYIGALAAMYATLASDIRETIKTMGINREGEPS